MPYRLKRRCPDCREGWLVLLTCPACRKMIAACDEDGGVFADGPAFDRPTEGCCDVWIHTLTGCPACRHVLEFAFSKRAEILGAGVPAGEFMRFPLWREPAKRKRRS